MSLLHSFLFLFLLPLLPLPLPRLRCLPVRVGARVARAATRVAAHRSPRLRGARGQTTAEYALVLVGAAALAVLLLAWATRTDRIGQLFDLVLDRITGHIR